MASAAEQLARNLNFGTFAKAKGLQQRIMFTLGALLIYRLGTFIPVPGIDPDVYAQTFETSQQGLVGVFDMFAGGAIKRMAIFAMSLLPYITASIVLQLVTPASPRLDALKKEGESGRRKLNQYTRNLAVVFCAVQAYGVAVGLEGSGAAITPGWFFRVSTVITLVGGTMFLMWLGEQITSRGIGNGISLIIMAGIVANLPGTLVQTLELSQTGALPGIAVLGILLLMIVVIAVIVFFERAQRRLLIQYPKRQVGNKMFQGDTSHLPLKLNTSGVIPIIFASSLLLMPAQIISFMAGGTGAPQWLQVTAALLGRGQPLYLSLYAAFTIFFCFFYTSTVFNPTETADNLKRSGGFIPGIRPGERTAQHIDYVLTRITVIGAAYLTLVALIPEILMAELSVSQFIGGTSLLIMVTVTLDTVSQVQSHLIAQQYEGLVKKSRLGAGAGRRR